MISKWATTFSYLFALLVKLGREVLCGVFFLSDQGYAVTGQRPEFKWVVKPSSCPPKHLWPESPGVNLGKAQELTGQLNTTQWVDQKSKCICRGSQGALASSTWTESNRLIGSSLCPEWSLQCWTQVLLPPQHFSWFSILPTLTLAATPSTLSYSCSIWHHCDSFFFSVSFLHLVDIWIPILSGYLDRALLM